MVQILRRITKVPYFLTRPTSTTTIDSQEIQQFQKKFNHWWDEFGPAMGLHSMNKLRVPFIRDGLINGGAVSSENIDTATPLKGLSVLDVGCGAGILSEPLARLGAKVMGIDANPCIVDLARNHAEKSKLPIEYVFTSIEDHCIENLEKYDALAVSEVIEHITEKEKFIAACSSCLKPSGSIFLTTLNKTWLAGFLAVYVAENIAGALPKGTHQLDKFIEPFKLQRILEDNKMGTKLVHGMFYNVFSNRWHWCSDTSVHYCLHAIKMKI